MEQFQSFLDQIETFDLIGFKGSGCISGIVSHIQTEQLSITSRDVDIVITHVGLAVRGEDLNKLTSDVLSDLKDRIDSKKVYIFESNSVPKSFDPVPDVYGHHPIGVKLRPLDDIILNFKGNIYYSTHIFPKNEELMIQFVKYINKTYGKPYEKSPLILLASALNCARIKIKTDSVFCSELVAKVLIELKILKSEVNPEHVVPLDFYIKPHCPTVTYDVDKEIPVLFKFPVKIK